MEAWQWSVAASDHQKLRSRVENSAHNTSARAAQEFDSSSQLVESAPQQDGRTSGMGERTEARLTPHTGAVQLCGRPLKSQCTMVGGEGLPPSSPDRGYSTASETMDTGIGTEATEGVGRGNDWCPQDWICPSLSRPIWGQR